MNNDNIPELVCIPYDKLTLADNGDGYHERLLLTVSNGDVSCSTQLDRAEVSKLQADLQRWLNHLDGLDS